MTKTKHPQYPGLAKTLRCEMHARKLTMQEFADLIGVKRITLGQYMGLYRYPYIPLLFHIADKLNISLDELVGREFPK